MRPPSSTAVRRAGLAAAALAALLLAGCSGSEPSAGGTATGQKTAPATSIAPSGDSDLDRLDTDLSAFEQENTGLDQAVVATKEG